jgi:hypothetical protein
VKHTSDFVEASPQNGQKFLLEPGKGRRFHTHRLLYERLRHLQPVCAVSKHYCSRLRSGLRHRETLERAVIAPMPHRFTSIRALNTHPSPQNRSFDNWAGWRFMQILHSGSSAICGVSISRSVPGLSPFLLRTASTNSAWSFAVVFNVEAAPASSGFSTGVAFPLGHGQSRLSNPTLREQ